MTNGVDGQPGNVWRALLIGNGAYESAPVLLNPVNDAAAVKKKLEDLGFAVRLVQDQKFEDFYNVYDAFLREFVHPNGMVPKESVVLFYFSGHGMQVKGQNYLVPVNARIENERDLRRQAINLNDLLNDLNAAATTTVIVLDCCRDNPFSTTWSAEARSRGLGTSRGLAPLQTQTRGAFIAFATAPDSVAEDGRGSNSPFTSALVQYIDQPFGSISEMMVNVRKKVFDDTYGRQIPWEHTWLLEPFTFKGVPKGVSLLDAQESPEERKASEEKLEQEREDEYWALVEKTDNPDLVRGFLRQYPNTTRRQLAIEKNEKLIQRKLARSVLVGAGSLFLVLGIIYLSYVGLKFMSFNRLDEYDLIGGDMRLELPTAIAVAEQDASSALMCKLRCAFRTRCRAANYEYYKGSKHGTCFMKDEVVYKIRNQNPSKSSLTSFASSWYAQPVDAPHYLYWGNMLEGTRIDPRTLPRETSAIEQTSANYFKVSSKLDCMATCHKLGQKCEGFTFMAVTGTCSLFSEVKQPALYASGECVWASGIYSGVRPAARDRIHALRVAGRPILCPAEKTAEVPQQVSEEPVTGTVP